jgi:hypothetical protein
MGTTRLHINAKLLPRIQFRPFNPEQRISAALFGCIFPKSRNAAIADRACRHEALIHFAREACCNIKALTVHQSKSKWCRSSESTE